MNDLSVTYGDLRVDGGVAALLLTELLTEFLSVFPTQGLSECHTHDEPRGCSKP